MAEEVILVEAEEVEPIINTEYEKYEINKTMAVDLAKGLPSIIKEREVLLSQVDAILILDKDDPNTAKKAAELRKQIKSNRTQGFEKWRKAQELADKQRKEKESLEAQLKKERDEKAAEEAKNLAEIEAERLRKEKVAKSGDKNILLDWIDMSFETPKSPDGLTEAGNAKVLEIVQKFESFRQWALKQIEQ